MTGRVDGQIDVARSRGLATNPMLLRNASILPSAFRQLGQDARLQSAGDPACSGCIIKERANRSYSGHARISLQ